MIRFFERYRLTVKKIIGKKFSTMYSFDQSYYEIELYLVVRGKITKFRSTNFFLQHCKLIIILFSLEMIRIVFSYLSVYIYRIRACCFVFSTQFHETICCKQIVASFFWKCGKIHAIVPFWYSLKFMLYLLVSFNIIHRVVWKIHKDKLNIPNNDKRCWYFEYETLT